MARRRSKSFYSRYVSLMKIILPLGIFLSIGFVIGWPYLLSMGKESLPTVDANQPEIRENRMVNPHYVSTDEKGRPFHLNAEWAKQQTENFSDLLKPEGSITMMEGETFNVKSNKGHYDSQTKVLTLEEKVVVTSTDGYNVETEKALLTIDNKTIEGDHFIKGIGPTGEIMGEKGFKVESRPQGKKVITLKGRSRVVINKVSLKKKKEKEKEPHAQ